MALLLTYSAAELYNVGQACLRLYREAEAARTREELEAVAERFGKALGGVGLRVVVTVAGGGEAGRGCRRCRREGCGRGCHRRSMPWREEARGET